MKPTPQTDAQHDLELVRRTRQGDLAAFEALVLKYQDTVYNSVYRMLNHRDDAAEVAQEVFLNLFRSIDRFREDAQFATYLWRTVINGVQSARRKRKVRQAVQVLPLGSGGEEQGESTDPPGAEKGPEALAVASEAKQAVTAAIASLDDDFQAVVVLKDLEGREYEEISEILEIPVGTVKSRLHRARCQLRGKLSDYQ